MIKTIAVLISLCLSAAAYGQVPGITGTLLGGLNQCGTSATTFSTSSSATAPGNSTTGAWTLSSGNRTASRTPTNTSTVSTAYGMLTRGYYWEVTVSAVGNGIAIGVIKGGDTLNSFLGSSANAWGYTSSGGLQNNGSAPAYGSTYTVGDIIGVAYNASLGALWFSKNGVWQNSATLAEVSNGVTTHAAATGLSGTWFGGIGNQSSSGTAVTGAGNFGQSTFSYPVPNGYIAGMCN